MGLDMYLMKTKKSDNLTFNELLEINREIESIDVDKCKDGKETSVLNEFQKKLYDDGVIVLHKKYFKYFSIFAEKEIAYWRKANHIHNWFVMNIQDDIDDCGIYEVTRDKLELLLNTCKNVLEKSELIDGKVGNGYIINNNGTEHLYIDGKVVKDSSVAEELLPTTSGYFFGGTDYDQYYIDDIKYTIEVIETILKTINFDEETVCYMSSW